MRTDDLYVLSASDVRHFFPERQKDSNKGTYGNALVIAGSPGMAGAAFFAAKAAYLSGAGLVRILTPEENRTVLQIKLPEAITVTYENECPDELLLQNIERATVILIGPGIGLSANSKKMLSTVVSNAEVPVIIDADGLNVLSEDLSILENTQADIILTPHMKELSRLLSLPLDETREARLMLSRDFAERNHVFLVSKDHITFVISPYGEAIRIISGDDSLSTAGTGDILAGMIAGLIASGMKCMDAAESGPFLHGRAGTIAGAKKGHISCMASDVLGCISAAITEVLS